MVEAGGRLDPAARKFIDEVLAECEMSEVARKAAASKILMASGIEVMRKQATDTGKVFRTMVADRTHELRGVRRGGQSA